MSAMAPFHDSYNRMEIWPSPEFRTEAHRGLAILKECHLRAGGTATLRAGSYNHCTSLVLRGPEAVVRETMRRGLGMYTLIGVARTKELEGKH